MSHLTSPSGRRYAANERERLHACLNFQLGGSVPNIEPGPLVPTWERWREEGLRLDLDPHDYDAWCDAFGWDHYPKRVHVSPPRPPLYEERVLEETESTVTRRRADGSIIQDSRGSHKSIYRELRPAVAERQDWERLKAWLEVDAPLPDAATPWVQDAYRTARSSTVPVWLHAGSLMGQVRNWLGFEAFAVMPFDDPAFIDDMFEVSCRLAEWQIRAFGENRIPVDAVHFWEDICFRTGPIIHPAVFRERIVPRYRRIAELCGCYGYEHVSVDSDGNLWALLDGWVDGGVNVIGPLEVQAGMDVNEVQARFGERVAVLGAVHKFRLTGGEQAIAAELERIRPAVRRGGYVPGLDHNVPHDVSLANYLTYCRLKRGILGVGAGPFDASRVVRGA